MTAANDATNGDHAAESPLSGLRVIDLSSGPVGGIATMVLADFGADVIKVERPGGDPFRTMANAPMWLRGKRSVELDLHREVERQRLHKLVKTADVAVGSFRGTAAVDLGADYEVLQQINPGLVYCNISSFGSYGPYHVYPGYEGVVAAKSGRMRTFAGIVDREGPAFAAVQAGSHAAAMAAVQGVLAGLLARERIGYGQFVETSMLQGMLPYDLNGLIRTQLARRDDSMGPDPLLEGGRMPTLNYHPVQTKDGRWIQLGNLLQHLFDNYLAAVDLLDVYADERTQGPPTSWAPEDREAFRNRMLERMREKTADEWMDIFVEHGGVAATIFRPTQEALDDPDLVLNGHVSETDAGPVLKLKAESTVFESVLGLVGERVEGGKVRQLGLLARLTETPGKPGGAPPLVGQHTHEVLAEPRAEWRASAPPSAFAGSHYALDHLTVLEFSTVIAAPLGAALLADLGARVIKVEPVGGDPYRGMGAGIGAFKTNTGKESIALDLKSPEGQAAVHKLIERADVIIHNYRPGVPDRLGIGYQQAKALKPDIIYLHVNGYGPDGPGYHRPATHPIPGAALGGALFQLGEGAPEGFLESIDDVRETARRLSRANEVNPDPNTSMVVASSALLALWARHTRGVGQQVFVDMHGANAYANADDFVSYPDKPDRVLPDRDMLGTGPTYRLYPAKDGTWVFLGLVLEKEWRQFCMRIGSPDLAVDPRFESAEAREANREALEALLGDLFLTQTADEWEHEMGRVGLGCVRADGPMPGEFWLDDRHAQMNGFVAPAPHARFGEMLRHGPVVRLHRTPGYIGPACLAGEHTDELLREIGYDDEAIAALRASGVAWSEPV